MSRLLLIFILGLFPFSAVLSQSATISTPFPLNETDLDFQSLTIELTDDTWADGKLNEGNFRLVNAPDGLTVHAIVLFL